MKRMILMASLAFSLSLSVEAACEKIRTAYDIGSGTTKVTIAKVDTCIPKIVEVLFRDDTPVAYKKATKASVDGKTIPTDIVEAGVKALRAYQEKSREFKSEETYAVATSVFRKSNNGKDVRSILEGIIEAPIAIVSQEAEGKLGFYSASAYANIDLENAVVWDIGGGSMQITTYNPEEKRLIVYQSQNASVTFNSAVIEKVLKEDPKTFKNVNPVMSVRKVKKIVRLSMGYVKEDLKKSAELQYIVNKIKKNKKTRVFAIGGVHNGSVRHYSIRNMCETHNVITKDDLMNAQYRYYTYHDRHLTKVKAKRCDGTLFSNDPQYVKTDYTNIGLVYGHTKVLGMKKYTVANVDLTYGILLASEIVENETKK